MLGIDASSIKIIDSPNESIDVLVKGRTAIVYSYAKNTAIFLDGEGDIPLGDPKFYDACLLKLIKYAQI